MPVDLSRDSGVIAIGHRTCGCRVRVVQSRKIHFCSTLHAGGLGCQMQEHFWGSTTNRIVLESISVTRKNTGSWTTEPIAKATKAKRNYSSLERDTSSRPYLVLVSVGKTRYFFPQEQRVNNVAKHRKTGTFTDLRPR